MHKSIKQKFKRECQPLQMTNSFVKLKQDKYGNEKSNGRPKKRSLILQAERRVSDVVSCRLFLNEELLSYFCSQ